MVFLREVHAHTPYAMFAQSVGSLSNTNINFSGLCGGTSTSEVNRRNLIQRTMIWLRSTWNVRGNSLSDDGHVSIRVNQVDLANSEVIITAGVVAIFDSGEQRETIASGSIIGLSMDGTASSTGAVTACFGFQIFEVAD